MALPKNIENEVKFKIENPVLFRRMLKQRRARQYPAVKEEDYYFDTPRKLLVKQDTLLRLRKSSNEVLITYKGAVLKGRFKKREEINIAVTDVKKAWELLTRLGFKGRLLKEKIRQQFVYRGISLFLDKLPFMGYYLEIEGSDTQIVRAAQLLGLDIRRAIKKNYNELFDVFCVEHRKELTKRKRPAFSFKSEKEFFCKTSFS